MLPEHYRRQRRVQENAKKAVWLAKHPVIFAAGFYLAGPAAHELGHFLFLQAEGCLYSSSFGFNIFSGLRAVFNPSCSLNPVKEHIFYSSGYGLTLLAGSASILSGSKISSEEAILIGIGSLASLTASLTLNGDLHSAPGSEQSTLAITGFLLISSASASIFGVDRLIKMAETE